MSARTCRLRRAPRRSSGRPVLLGPGHDLLGVQRDERDEVRAPVAVHHGLGDPAGLLEVVLDVGGREVLAAGRDDDVLLAAGDRQVAVVVELAEVAGVQPAVAVERLGGGLGVLPVAREDVRAAHQDLAVLGDRHLDAGQRRARPCRTGTGSGVLTVPTPVDLGHAVALQHRHARGVEELEDLRRRSARRRSTACAHPAAEERAHGLNSCSSACSKRLVQLGGTGSPRARSSRTSTPASTPRRRVLRSSVGALDRRGGERVDLLEDPRHRREVVGLHLGQLGDDLLRVAAEVGDRGARRRGTPIWTICAKTCASGRYR